MNPTQKVVFAAMALSPFHGAVQRLKHRRQSPVPRRIQVELVINLQTAQKLGLTIPQSVLFQADRVIK
jgi:hypothetical protein